MSRLKELAAKKKRERSQQQEIKNKDVTESKTVTENVLEQITADRNDENVQRFYIDEIEVIEQGRILFEEIESLADDIYENDIEETIKVVKLGNRIILQDGERRYRAVSLLNSKYPDDSRWKKITAKVGEFKSWGNHYLRQFALNDTAQANTPLEEARFCKLIFDSHKKDNENYSMTMLAKEMKKSTSWVSERIKLLSLPKNIQEDVHHAKIGLRSAISSYGAPAKDNERGKKLNEIKVETKSTDTNHEHNTPKGIKSNVKRLSVVKDDILVLLNYFKEKGIIQTDFSTMKDKELAELLSTLSNKLG